MMDIDLVYLWVNGNDPEWIAKRNACIGKTTEKQENCEARYADSGELKYSLRSVEKYAPWIRKIFIVTDNQVPEWLDTSNPRVQIVDHTEIMPAECLPCFNSVVIEHHLHNIPGLSEHFLCANDDCYINQPISPLTFFCEDGMPVIYMNRKPFRKFALRLAFLIRKRILKKSVNLNVQAVSNASLLVEREFGKYYGDKPHHNIDAYLKSTMAHVHQLFSKELTAMRVHHMRSPEDIHRCIYSYVDLAEKRGHLRYVTQEHSFRLHINDRDMYQELERCNPVLFCMNDTEHATDDDRKNSIRYLKNKFPEKSGFEK